MTTTYLGPQATPTPEWWRQAVVYQIYPRSFADASGEGLGDIAGITSRADYLNALGIDAVWLSPFYPSELADGGYDVADYRNVDPKLGTLDDFDDMVAALHGHDIKIIVDIVPNHTSDQHEWFQAALKAGRGSKEHERYIFREGKGSDGSEPPTDWEGAFGGPAWERVEDGQWYLHNFAVEQPDLNWDNREVRDDFLKTLRFWSDRGVDGFRIDVAHMLTKDLSEPLPSKAELDAMPIDGNHPMIDRDDVMEVYREWRQVFNSYDPPRTAVAEAHTISSRVPRYASPETLGQSFNFDLLRAAFDAAEFEEIVTHNLAQAAESGSSTTWVLSNHDEVRHATRYGLPLPEGYEDYSYEGMPKGVPSVAAAWLYSGGKDPVNDEELGLRRARAATMFLLGLPGSTYFYQGEELGLQEVVDIPADKRQDPTFFDTDGLRLGRDGCRVPIPWEATPAEGDSFGFGTNGAHLPQPAWFKDYAVDVEDADPASTLNLYREALRKRRELEEGSERLAWVRTDRDDVLQFQRPNGWNVVTNFGDEPFALPDGTEVLAASEPVDGLVVPGATTVWFKA